MSEKGALKTWRKRWAAASSTKKEWEKKDLVNLCYNYWRGDQLEATHDGQGRAKIQVNKIAPEVKNAIASVHFYHPYVRVHPRPEAEDSTGTAILEDTQLLQDTANHLVRQERTRFRESTYLGTWSPSGLLALQRPDTRLRSLTTRALSVLL